MHRWTGCWWTETVHLLFFLSGGVVNVVFEDLQTLPFVIQLAFNQLQSLRQLGGAQPVHVHIPVHALQLWAESYQALVQLLNLPGQESPQVLLYLQLLLSIGWSKSFKAISLNYTSSVSKILTWRMTFCSESTCWFSSLILSSLAGWMFLLLFSSQPLTSGLFCEVPDDFSCDVYDKVRSGKSIHHLY